jgi:hypothetical protein
MPKFEPTDEQRKIVAKAAGFGHFVPIAAWP